MEHKLDTTIEAIKSDITALGQHIASLAKTLKGQAAERGNGADKSSHLDVKDFFDGLQNQGEDMARNVVDHVKTHPAQSLVIAFGAGFLAAALIQQLASRDQEP